jgi:hypothetical protein
MLISLPYGSLQVDWQYRQFEFIKYVHGLIDDIKGTGSRNGLGFCLHVWVDQGINKDHIFNVFLDAPSSG